MKGRPSFLSIITLLLFCCIGTADGVAATLAETEGSERTSEAPRSDAGIEEGIDEEKPIMTIGYVPARCRSNPLLKGRAVGTATQASGSSVAGAAGGILGGLLALLLMVLFAALVLPDILN